MVARPSSQHARAQKWASPIQDSSCWLNQLHLKQQFNRFADLLEWPKLDSRRDHCQFKGVHFLILFEFVSFAQETKTIHPQQVESGASLEVRFYSSRFQPQLLLVKSASNWNKDFNKFATMKGSKRDQNWTLHDSFWNTFLLHGGLKLDPQQVESDASLKVRF